jgi:transcriptional regulator with XRE-family HTH domain
MVETRGQSALTRYLAENTQTSVAKTLAVEQSTVSLWKRGLTRPEPHHRRALELLTGIPEADWETDDERAVVERVRAGLAATGTHS